MWVQHIFYSPFILLAALFTTVNLQLKSMGKAYPIKRERGTKGVRLVREEAKGENEALAQYNIAIAKL